MSGVRTYNPSVRVANWIEDLCLEEDLLKDFLDKKERGELLIDKSHNLKAALLQKVNLSVTSSDNCIRFGDVVCIYNPEHDVVLSIHVKDTELMDATRVEAPCGMSASKSLQPCVRNSFVIKSCDEANDGDQLLMGQEFLLCSLPGAAGDLKIQSDRATFTNSAKKSRLQEVVLENKTAYPSHWQILCFDPKERLETEGYPIQANEKLLINHCKTNQRLCVLPQHTFRTVYGQELEITAHTNLNSHRAEEPVNHWILVTRSQEQE